MFDNIAKRSITMTIREISGCGIGKMDTSELELETFKILERKPDTVQGSGV